MSRDRFILGVPLGRFQTNCYIVGDRSKGTAAVVDPGEGGERWVPHTLERFGVTCEAILLSHAHLDHIWGVPGLAEVVDAPIFLHPEDRWIWDDPGAGTGFGGSMLLELLGGEWDPPTDRLEDLRDGQRLVYAGIPFTVNHTPGHTPGHVTFLVEGVADADVGLGRPIRRSGDEVLLSGDLIFAGSVGRTDFPRGDFQQLLDSIERTVLPLDDETVILSGHGPETTVGLERGRNPFVAQLLDKGA